MPPLSDIPSNTTVQVVAITADEATAYQLEVFGMLSNQSVKVIKNSGKTSPLVIEIGSSRFTIGHEIAREIEVKEEGNHKNK